MGVGFNVMPLSNSQTTCNAEGQAKAALAILVSLVAHLTFFLVLACWVFMPGVNREAVTVNFGLVESDATALLETSSAVDEWEQELPALSMEVSATLQSLDLSVDLLETTLERAEDVKADLAAVASLASFSGQDAAEAQSQSESLQGASFFGAYAPGSRFVYILDTSRSMTGERWELAKQKLLQSLRELGPSRQFFVICFDARTTLLFDRNVEQLEFLAADAKTIQRVSRWLRSVQLGPATMPAQALQLGLHLQPDAIFFLSDGELHDDSLFRLRWLNVETGSKRRIPIHAVHLISHEGRHTLEQIANENGGSFTYISDRTFSRGRP